MQTEVANKIVEICNILNKHTVRYLIVGGSAVAYHGYFRWSADVSGFAAKKFDLDFWYHATYNNYFNLLYAFRELGQDVENFINEQEPDPKKSFFKFEIENFTLDFLPSLKGENDFMSSYQKRDLVKLNGIEISFINIDDLIADKSVNSRPKDIEDIKQLKKRKNRE